MNGNAQKLIKYLDDAPKEMALSILPDDLYQIVIELLAVFHFPIIIPLVYRNDKSFRSAI